MSEDEVAEQGRVSSALKRAPVLFYDDELAHLGIEPIQPIIVEIKFDLSASGIESWMSQEPACTSARRTRPEIIEKTSVGHSVGGVAMVTY